MKPTEKRDIKCNATSRMFDRQKYIVSKCRFYFQHNAIIMIKLPVCTVSNGKKNSEAVQ